jgi:hypothetical protein
MSVLIFDSYEDIKPHISGSQVTNQLETLESYLTTAQRDFLLPYFGSSAWDQLITGYENGETDSRYIQARDYARSFLVNIAYFLWASDGGINVSDAGFGQTNSTESRAPFQWQMRKFEASKRLSGFNALEKLLSYTESNKDYFTGWDGSEERTIYISFFIREVKTFNLYRKISDFETLLALWPYMQRVQQNGFRQITKTLFDSVYSEYKAGTLSEDNTVLIPYFREYIAHQSLCQALYELNFTISASGFMLDNIKAESGNSFEQRRALDEISSAKSYLQEAADNAMVQLLGYLRENASETKYISFYTEVVQVEAVSGNNTQNLQDELKSGPTFGF